MKLIYLPLECYKERYTYFMSCQGGWAEEHFKNNNIQFIRVEPYQKEVNTIKAGVVVDAFKRSTYSMEQVIEVIKMIQEGLVTSGDVVYTEDFWHPGIEALFYIRELTGIDFKVGCFIHAQSIDDSDFTYPMKKWITDIERGYSKGYDYVFTCSPILKEIAIKSGYNKNSLYVTGLPYNSKRLLEQLKQAGHAEQEKEPFVLFSSRFDAEKNPNFFLDLVERCPDINFKLVKPREKLSNKPEIEERALKVSSECKNFEIVDTSSKLKYYNLLARAKVQFNCAIQDWVSWTLLEAITFKCLPLYPNWKDFPFELAGFEGNHIYENKDLEDAEKKLRKLMTMDFNEELNIVVQKHDESWNKKLQYMGF